MRQVIPFVVAGASVWGVLSGPAGAQVVREGTGERRSALNAMELAPFPGELWSKLSGLTGGGGGEAIAAGATTGSVVLICTWSSWYPASLQSLTMGQRLADRYAEQGLVVVGVHHKEGWDEAAKTIEARKTTFLQAHDAEGAFRAGLKVDQDPDFYLIDRAGQLRYADIETGSVEGAVAGLIAETAEAAADVPTTLAKGRELAQAEARKTGQIRGGVQLRELPEVEFTPPTPEQYGAASVVWPKRQVEENSFSSGLPPEPQVIKLPEEGWYPSKPATSGRATVLYVWTPFIRQSYDLMPSMDLLQQQKGRDLTVVGVGVLPPNFMQGGALTPELEKLIKDMSPVGLRDFMQGRVLSHSLLPDPAGALVTDGTSGAVQTFPFAVVMSSDNTVRWKGDPRRPAFKAAVDQVIRYDPGVQARREAEASYLRSAK